MELAENDRHCSLVRKKGRGDMKHMIRGLLVVELSASGYFTNLEPDPKMEPAIGSQP